MSNLAESVQYRSRGAVVLTLAVLYLFFAFSYVWYLPNYNLLRQGGRFHAGSHATFKVGIRHSNYNTQADKGIWLEKISKATPETKRGIGLVLIGTAVIMAVLFVAQRILPGVMVRRQNSGYGIFAHQYAYLSLRAFRI
ncbi:MAG TPA: hypothetical protein VG367_20625 [Mucilaginibacter sp.]|jgi:hypothetical protein|nr:hypothetical protein [Mucilaginibacter sp.]